MQINHFYKTLTSIGNFEDTHKGTNGRSTQFILLLVFLLDSICFQFGRTCFLEKKNDTVKTYNEFTNVKIVFFVSLKKITYVAAVQKDTLRRDE